MPYTVVRGPRRLGSGLGELTGHCGKFHTLPKRCKVASGSRERMWEGAAQSRIGRGAVVWGLEPHQACLL